MRRVNVAVQRRLPLPGVDDRGLATLIIGEAMAGLAARLLNPGASWPRGAFVLLGGVGSGKSHWAQAFLERHGGARVAARADLADALAQWRAEGGALAIDDADRVINETGLFALLEHAASGGGLLLLTSQTAPDRWAFGMRDLVSRACALPQARLEDPDEAMLMALLTRLCRQRFLRLDAAVAQSLARTMERSYAEAHRLVEALDALTANHGRPISLGLAQRALALINPAATPTPWNGGAGDGEIV